MPHSHHNQRVPKHEALMYLSVHGHELTCMQYMWVLCYSLILDTHNPPQYQVPKQESRVSLQGNSFLPPLSGGSQPSGKLNLNRMENWQRRFSNTNDQTVLFSSNGCLPIQCPVLRFSKCGSVSSDRMLTRPSKHTLFLRSRCQSYFLVSSHDGPVQICQACFLRCSLFALWHNFTQICLF